MPSERTALPRRDRRDKLGRRIGYNWWREYNVEQYICAREAWELLFETEANQTWKPGLIQRERRLERRGGRREVTDFIEAHPPPTFKEFLIGNKGIGIEPDEQAA